MDVQHYPKPPNLCFFAFGHHSLSLTLALMSESAELHYFTKKDPPSGPGIKSSNGIFYPMDPNPFHGPGLMPSITENVCRPLL